MFELTKYRGVMFDGTEDWYKIWRKISLCFQKWHEEFDKFSQDENVPADAVWKLYFTWEINEQQN